MYACSYCNNSVWQNKFHNNNPHKNYLPLLMYITRMSIIMYYNNYTGTCYIIMIINIKLLFLTFWAVHVCTLMQLLWICRVLSSFSILREGLGFHFKFLHPLLGLVFHLFPWPAGVCAHTSGYCSLFRTGYVAHREYEENCCSLHDALIFQLLVIDDLKFILELLCCRLNRLVLLLDC